MGREWTTYPKEVLDQGRRIYEPIYGRPLSDDEMQEITNNVVGVAKWLIRAEQRRLDAEAASARDPDLGGATAREDGE